MQVRSNWVYTLRSIEDEPYVYIVGGLRVTTLQATHPVSVVCEQIWNEQMQRTPRRLKRRARKARNR